MKKLFSQLVAVLTTAFSKTKTSWEMLVSKYKVGVQVVEVLKDLVENKTLNEILLWLLADEKDLKFAAAKEFLKDALNAIGKSLNLIGEKETRNQGVVTVIEYLLKVTKSGRGLFWTELAGHVIQALSNGSIGAEDIPEAKAIGQLIWKEFFSKK